MALGERTLRRKVIVDTITTCESRSIRLSKDYGEPRVICYGLLAGRLVVVGYTPRGADRHIFSMRKANEREQARIAPLLEV